MGRQISRIADDGPYVGHQVYAATVSEAVAQGRELAAAFFEVDIGDPRLITKLTTANPWIITGDNTPVTYECRTSSHLREPEDENDDDEPDSRRSRSVRGSSGVARGRFAPQLDAQDGLTTPAAMDDELEELLDEEDDDSDGLDDD